MTDNRSAIILLGSPGAGKTTVAEMLAAAGGRGLIEPGRLFRDEARRQTALGERIEPFLRSGRLVPRDLVAETMATAIERETASLLIFDGFPRIKEQVNLFFLMANRLRFSLAAVIVLAIPHVVAVKRLAGRRVCPNDGSIYNIYLNPPRQNGICDLCGAQLRQRSDDRPEIVERRLSVYERDTLPLEDYFVRNYPLITFEIDAGKPVQQVVTTVEAILAGIAPVTAVR